MNIAREKIEEAQAVLSPGTDRTLAIIELLGAHPEGLTIAEIVRRLELSQNSVYRITQTLAVRGYLVRHDDDKRYQLTSRLFELSQPRVGEKSLVECSYAALKALRDRTGETAQIMVRSGSKGVVLEQASAVHPVQVMGAVGLCVPLYSCAPGKSILAYLPESELNDWFKSVELKSFTARTVSTRKSLTRELALTRERGYAIDLAEGLEGIHCVAAPIFDAYDYPVAAVTVMGPIFRVSEDQFEALGQASIDCAATVHKRLLE
jgi:DNA-binding IclR family transcriptional regulator